MDHDTPEDNSARTLGRPNPPFNGRSPLLPTTPRPACARGGDVFHPRVFPASLNFLQSTYSSRAPTCIDALRRPPLRIRNPSQGPARGGPAWFILRRSAIPGAVGRLAVPSAIGRPERGREGTRAPAAPSPRPAAPVYRPYCTRRRPEALLLAAADVHRAAARGGGGPAGAAPAPGPAPPRGACAPACVSLRGVHGGRERARLGAPDGFVRWRPGRLPGPCVVPGGLSPSISDGVVELLSFRARPSAVSSTVLLRAGAGYTGGPVRYYTCR